MRILYIEDNTTNVTLVQRVANMGKHEVMNYGDGQEALDHFERYKPDLILLDVQLCGTLTGLAVAHTLRAKGCTSPIIAVTAYAMKGDRQRCLEAGCDDYLPKPISVTELVTVFKRYSDAVASGKPITSAFKVTSAAPGAFVNTVAPQPIVLVPSATEATPLVDATSILESSTSASTMPSQVVATTSALPEVTTVEAKSSLAESSSKTTPLPISEKVVHPSAGVPSVERTSASVNAES